MSAKQDKATVLILAGLQYGPTRALVTYLSPLAQHIRIVDKALVILPGAKSEQDGGSTSKSGEESVWLCYSDPESKAVFEQGARDWLVSTDDSAGRRIEYLQGNLLREDTRQKAFSLPSAFSGKASSYDYVFDFTGEYDFEGDEQLHLERTTLLAAQLGKLAAELRVKAYVRLLPPYYQIKGDKAKRWKTPISESDLALPWNRRARWHHEAVRALASIPSLNLVIARHATLYGRYMLNGLAKRLLIGSVYQYLQEKMEFLWGEDLPQYTVHVDDLCRAMWALADWMSKTGRIKGDELASANLAPCRPIPSWVNDYVSTAAGNPAESNEPTQNTLSKKQAKAAAAAYDDTEIDTLLAKRTATVTAPLFNIVDQGATSQGHISAIVAKLVGVKSGFHGSLINQFAKLNMDAVLEDANQKHLECWPEMLATSDPPISNAYLTPYLAREQLLNEPIILNGDKLCKLLEFEYKHPRVTEQGLRDMLDAFRAQNNVWPNAKKSSS
ncbi:uncharacterized protein L969DRAFT_87904 [Mixia osmundae IAM 14324]|nr:uncharacterized protein L969DRAFT_87904 [Mixia osmundae IAM 14324]KEI38676.1 hypothetical protein L969DRAFT_87904 [Mixia osmundae IAM 14324]